MEEARRVLERKFPAYDLETVRHGSATGRFEITRRVRRHLYRKGWDPERISECVLSLGREDFHKSQQHRDRRGVWLDIYRPHWCGERLYVKFVLHEDGETFVVLTFCVDGEQH
ncbi:MAG: type II toxin-antitoxin system MqsR family toxin [Anaerosomatales bacterium]